MGWLFGRSKGRHALGAAVRAIPAGPLVSSWGSVAPPPPPPPPPPPLPAIETPSIPSPEPPAVVEADPVLLPTVDLLAGLSAYSPVVPPQGPRGEMTFRDGTTAELDPEQARALDQIAQALTGRGGVKH